MELKIQQDLALLDVDDLGKVIRTLATGKKSLSELVSITEIDRTMLQHFYLNLPIIKKVGREITILPAAERKGRATPQYELNREELIKYRNMLERAYGEVREVADIVK